MTTLDAWVSMVVLLAALGLAFWPRAAARAANLPGLRRVGVWSTAAVNRWYWLLFAAIMLLGVWIRVWRVPEVPGGVYHDEAMNAAEALSLLRTGADQYGTSWPVHFNAWRYGQMSALLPYLTVPFLAMFGVTRLAIRLPILIMSLLALPVMWDLSRRVLGRRFALLALALTAICPWQIVQSRWALDCNTMGHMFLFATYFLLLGLEKKPWLYVSMVFFGLTMYSYGVALYTVPVFLLAACAYLLRQKRLRWGEVVACGAVYLAVAWPFLLTMVINALEWETIHVGAMTLERFPDSGRAKDILLFSEDPLRQFIWNLQSLLAATVMQTEGDTIAAYFATRSLYAFSLPAIVAGVYLVWRRRRGGVPERALAAAQQTHTGLTLMFFWVCAMLLCGLLTNFTTSQRSNAIFYPLLFCVAYALYEATRRVRWLAPVLVALYVLGFTTFYQGYFHDASYRLRTDAVMENDLYGALVDVRYMDCDQFYLYTKAPEEPKITEVVAMVAHELDGAQIRDERPVPDATGALVDDYSNRYVYTNFAGFEPDPMECAAYVIPQRLRELFDPNEFIIKDFGLHASVYPRYWAEE